MPSLLITPETLSKGLRSTSRHNGPSVVECKGVRPSAHGLSAYEPLGAAFTNLTLTDAGIYPQFPFPQLFRGKGYTLLCDRTAIYLVDEDTWGLTALSVYAPGSSTPTTISEGGAWQFADFTDCWLLTNGVHLLYKRPNDVRIRRVAFPCGTICEHLGRLFVGGATTLWGSGWQTITDAAINNAPAAFQNLDTLNNPSNYVWWSNVNSLDLFWFLLGTTSASAGPLTTHASSSPYWLEMMERGDWGFAPTPYKGKVTWLAPLGRSVVAYGDNGVTRLTPIVEPVPTMSLQPLNGTGLFERGAVAASSSRHIFLDSHKAVWQIGPESINRLDYQEFGTLFQQPMLGCVEPEENIAYLTDGNYSLMFTESGVTQALECPTSLYSAYGQTVGVVLDAPESQQKLEVIIDLNDLGQRGLKTLESLVIAGVVPDGTTAAIDYRNSPLEDWTRDTARELSGDEGAALDLHVTADYFRVVLQSDEWIGTSLENVEIWWREYDKRWRGTGGKRVTA